jgi:thiol-disulfide isomerase/thioredoxin
LCLALALPAAAALRQPYRAGEWKALVRSHAGQPLIVFFWGIACGPALDEMPKWGRFVRERNRVKVVFIEVDQAPEKAALEILAEAKLESVDHRGLVSDFDPAMRREIDVRWAGELPFTLLVGADGTITRQAGTVDFAAIRAWLVREGAAASGR